MELDDVALAAPTKEALSLGAAAPESPDAQRQASVVLPSWVAAAWSLLLVRPERVWGAEGLSRAAGSLTRARARGCDPVCLSQTVGPMFSGKTSELQARLRRHALAGRRVVMLKASSDTRYDATAVVSHDGASSPGSPVACLADGAQLAAQADVVGVDEAQFLPDLQVAEGWAADGKVVIVAGLDATFERGPFMHVLRLIPTAESVTKLCAVCAHCGVDAAFTHRTVATTAAAADVSAAVLIGGAEAYQPLCRQCHAAATAAMTVPSPHARLPVMATTDQAVHAAVASPPMVALMSSSAKAKRNALAYLSNGLRTLDLVSSPMAQQQQQQQAGSGGMPKRVFRAATVGSGSGEHSTLRQLR